MERDKVTGFNVHYKLGSDVFFEFTCISDIILGYMTS